MLTLFAKDDPVQKAARMTEDLKAEETEEEPATVILPSAPLVSKVPEETEIRTGAPIYTGKVCVIGSNLKEDALKAAFEQ